MVKNTGGGKHKGIARKFVNSNDASALSETKTRVIRVPDEECYAQVARRLGGSICEVVTHEGDRFQCHIRGKFSGKFKRSNCLEVGSFVLVGKRAWESVKKNVDLLHVYLPHDVQYLKSLHGFFKSDSNLVALTPQARARARAAGAAGAAGEDDDEQGGDVIFSNDAVFVDEQQPVRGGGGNAKAKTAPEEVGGGGGGALDDVDFDLI